VEPVFRWNLLTRDPDDNKFVDCAIAARVHGLITEDKGFAVLQSVGFPVVPCYGIRELENLFFPQGKSPK